MQIVFLVLQSQLVFALSQKDATDRQGILDLTDFKFKENGTAPLTGPWEFYWKQLLTPKDFLQKENLPTKSFMEMPGLWKGKLPNGETLSNRGYATYRLQVATPTTDNQLALRIPKFYSSCKIWINGRLRRECGQVTDDKKTTIHKRKSATIPFSPSENGKTEIIIQVANFYHKNGGVSQAPSVGYLDTIIEKNESYAIADAMLSTSLVILGFAFAFLYSLWRKDRAVLYFALFCLFWAYRNISDTYAPLLDVIPFLNWEFNAKLKYIALYFGSLAGSLYFKELFHRYAHPRYNILVLWTTVFFALVTLFSPNNIFTYYLLPFFVFMLVNLMYITVLVIKSIIAKRPSSVYAILCILLGVLVFTAHMVIFYSQRDDFVMYINIGYMGFFFLSATLLGVRFSLAFFKLELLQVQTLEQKEELKTQTDMLKVVNDQIVHQKQLLEEKNQEINIINRNLENTISERTSTLKKTNKELDMFLYRASHDLRRPISSIMGIDQVAKLTVKEKEALGLFKKVQNVVQAMDMMLKKFISISEIHNHEIQFTHIELDTIKNIIVNQATFYGKVNKIEDYELDIDGPSCVFSDLFIINKITTYLLENAFMFAIPEQPEKLRIAVTFRETGNLLSLEFSDNGMGIKKELIDKIFNMYFIGTVKSNGNGLGLYIVKKAAEKLGEEITVGSKEDGGTTFHLMLNKST